MFSFLAWLIMQFNGNDENDKPTPTGEEALAS